MQLFVLLALLASPILAIVISDGGGGRGRGFDSSSDSHEHGGWHSHSHEHGRPPRPRPPVPNPPPPPPPPPPPAQCEAGWQRFDRPSGPWCIRVVNSIVDYAGAAAQCQGFGGRLSGLQNYGELTYVTGEVLRHQSSGSVWVGAERVAACIGQKLGGACTPQTAFRWTDGSTTGTAGFNWDRAMPDNYGKRIQNCAVLLASTAATVRHAGLTWQANHLDDTACNGIVNTLRGNARRIYGFICGKRPT